MYKLKIKVFVPKPFFNALVAYVSEAIKIIFNFSIVHIPHQIFNTLIINLFINKVSADCKL